MTDKLNAVQRDMLYLAACALNGKAPDRQRTAEMNLPSLYRLAKRHSMSAIIYMALDSANAFGADSELKKLWRESKDKAIRKSVLLDAELSQLGKLLAENKIWYMPLKGSVLKHYYPKLGMREMS
ncbi:MAG: nucleotidyltransferase family protein, partial [Acutalibacteraceae bacterium]